MPRTPVRLEDLVAALAVERERDAAVRVVLSCGCFDPLNAGHVRHFRAARALGDVLVVLVTADTIVRLAKGSGRPAVPEAERAEVVAAVDSVDYACVNRTGRVDWETAVIAINLLRPVAYAKGVEYEGKLTEALKCEKAAVEMCGGKLVFTDTEATHSSEILRRLSACGPVGGEFDRECESVESD